MQRNKPGGIITVVIDRTGNFIKLCPCIFYNAACRTVILNIYSKHPAYPDKQGTLPLSAFRLYIYRQPIQLYILQGNISAFLISQEIEQSAKFSCRIKCGSCLYRESIQFTSDPIPVSSKEPTNLAAIAYGTLKAASQLYIGKLHVNQVCSCYKAAELYISAGVYPAAKQHIFCF